MDKVLSHLMQLSAPDKLPALDIVSEGTKVTCSTFKTLVARLQEAFRTLQLD